MVLTGLLNLFAAPAGHAALTVRATDSHGHQAGWQGNFHLRAAG
jgi:hypothetical protein